MLVVVEVNGTAIFAMAGEEVRENPRIDTLTKSTEYVFQVYLSPSFYSCILGGGVCKILAGRKWSLLGA